MNLYGYNPEICTDFEGQQQNIDPFSYCSEFADFSALRQPLDECHSNPFRLGQSLDGGAPIEVPEIPDTCFNYISNLLREDNIDHRPSATLHDYLAAQLSYNKSLDAALLGENSSFLADDHCFPHICQTSRYCLDDYLNMFSSNLSGSNNNVVHANAGNSNVIGHQNIMGGNVANLGPSGTLASSNFEGLHQYENGIGFITNQNWELGQQVSNGLNSNTVQTEQIQSLRSLPNVQGGSFEQVDVNFFPNTLLENHIPQVGLMSSHDPSFIGRHEIVDTEVQNNNQHTINPSDKPRGRKHSEGNEGENQAEHDQEMRRGKQSAHSSELCDQIEKLGDVFLCPEGRNKPAALCTSSRLQILDQKEQESADTKGLKKRGSKRQVVDLRALLTRCAQCVARVDLHGAYELLKQIREHASPHGDFLQRVAHYLANALEARLEGKGLELTRANEHIAACEVLKANRIYVASVPFKIMSYYTTNKTIASLVEVAPSIHIIDFGIYYGLQWPCIIQNLSKRPNGPPKIRITGIDFPQRGFRPAERVEETGRCLAQYCAKYNVPFEYHAIAQPWETIQLEDLKITRNEPLVVNCLYRSHNLFDESVDDTSPRDTFLSFVRKINPDIFMHGIVNSTSSVPFFLNRFKEAMFHYSALFDIFEATMSREDEERMLLESKVYANQALNVIACEGIERVERPEAYKQWQVRTLRAAFKQVPIDRELLRRAKAMVKRSYREEFSYDEDGHWVVQGWKGRIMYAISCWKPT